MFHIAQFLEKFRLLRNVVAEDQKNIATALSAVLKVPIAVEEVIIQRNIVSVRGNSMLQQRMLEKKGDISKVIGEVTAGRIRLFR